MARKNYNRWIFEGNLLREPEMRYTPGGHPVTTLFVACNNTYKAGQGDEIHEVTELVVYKAQAWNGLAEICNQYLKKGNRVLIEAAPLAEQKSEDIFANGRPRIWTDKDGHVRADFECKVIELHMLSSAPKADTRPEPQAEARPSAKASEPSGPEAPVPAGEDAGDYPF